MNRICFSHDYPKLHGQTTAQLLAVKPLTVDRNTDADLLEYDTHFYQPRGGVGHYILKPGKYLRLIFDGNKGIPFTTIRKAYPPQKTEYYLGKIGETFEVWVIPDKGGAV